MNVKLIVEEWLKEHKYDGLMNPDVPCGCLLGDLAPCGEIHENCRPGHREVVDKYTVCDCDGQGTEHWHVFMENGTDFNPYIDPTEWLCDCGQRCDPMAAEWRWNGRDWEHHHGYPVGHVTATRAPAAGMPCGKG